MVNKVKKIITTEEILKIARMGHSSEKQRKVNEIVIGFADNDMCLASVDTWDVYCSVIHKCTSVSEEMKKLAYFNAFENQLQLLRMKNQSKENTGR